MRKQVSVRVNGELSESFTVEVGVRQGCVMSLRLFNIYMDGCIREMKVGVWDLGARMNVRGVEQPLVVGLHADDTVLLAENEGMLQRTVYRSPSPIAGIWFQETAAFRESAIGGTIIK